MSDSFVCKVLGPSRQALAFSLLTLLLVGGCAPSSTSNPKATKGEVVEIETIEVIPAEGKALAPAEGKASAPAPTAKAPAPAPTGIDAATAAIDEDVSATKKADEAKKAADEDKKADDDKAAADEAKAAADKAITEASQTIEPVQEKADDAAADPDAASPAVVNPAAADAAAGGGLQKAATTRVELGDPNLTAGVPGNGPITLEQIDQWLSDPKNSAELIPVLPLGLSQGAGQIQGIDRNPLTLAKIELGRQLYFDPRLSIDSTVSCASCHSPAEGYSARTKTGVGIRSQLGGRNSPVSFNRILSGPQFWDGRADSLEAQAIGPIANPIEMGFTHAGVVARLKEIPVYKQQFTAIFGDLTIDGVGKAIAAFERVLVTAPSPYDYNEQLRGFAALDADDIADDPELAAKFAAAKAGVSAHPMSEEAKRGREIFFTEKGNCTACHVGANLADEKYHNLGIGMEQPEPDLGRLSVTQDARDTGAFKTPTVRNVALSAPYMHDGSMATLEEVVEWYDKGGHPNPHLSDKIRPLKLSPQEKAELVDFMKACTGPTPTVEVSRLPSDK